MSRLGIIVCALLLSGCNSLLPGAPEASAPPEVVYAAPGVVVLAPVDDLDCAPRSGAITCN